jgi:hypothetical protein
MRLERRIRALEETANAPGWPETSVELYVIDGRLNPPDPEPDRLALIVKAGTPKGGEVFHRGPDESETDFIERTKQHEIKK